MTKIAKDEIEIETKLDVPLCLNIDDLINKVKIIMEEENWEIISERSDEKDLLYYDTYNLQFHKEGSTLRRVTPFDSNKFSGRVRYDFKQGKAESRLERKSWSYSHLDGKGIIELLGIAEKVERIKPIVGVHINPRFLDIEKDGTGAELKLDACYYRRRPILKELEIELKSGDRDKLYKLSGLIADYFGFRTLVQQKYSRVIEILNFKGRRK